MPTGKYTAADIVGNATPSSGARFTAADIAPDIPSVAPTGIDTGGATISAAPAPTWLQQAESDVRYGGHRTAIGAILGAMQGGNGGRGYTGATGGVSPAAAQFMASPALGIIHGAQGAQETVSGHPVSGIVHSIQGGLEAATIPSLVIGSPATEAGAAAIPSAKHAGQVFDQIMSEAHHLPVNISSATSDALLRAHELGESATLPKAANNLLKRVTDPARDLTYKKAQDFVTNISRLSADDIQRLTPAMKTAMGSLREALRGDIQATAATVGHGENYAAAVKEYAQAKSLSNILQKVAKWGAGVAGAGGAIHAYDQFQRR